MSLPSAAIRYLADKGLSASDIADFSLLLEGPRDRTPAAVRQARYRDRLKEQTITRDVTNDVTRDVTEQLSRVVYTSLPSLRSEELNPLENPTGSIPQGGTNTPRKAKTTKPSRRAPEGWTPSDRTVTALSGEGFTAGDLERALTRMRDHEFKVPRQDWEATFRNWCREDRERRPANSRNSPDGLRPDPKRTAREANLSRAFAAAHSVAARRE